MPLPQPQRVAGVVLSALVLATAAAHAQAPADEHLTFRHLTISDGLSQNAVSSIVQDRRGFMWFGTKDGLNRYDGYEFVVYHHDPFDSTTVSDSKITELFEDSGGRLWVGTEGGGLNRFDRAQGTFHRFADGPRQAITAIAEDGGGGLWIGTDGDGLHRFDPATGRFDPFRHDPSDPHSLSNDHVNAVLVDRRGVLWVGTRATLDRLDSPRSATATSGLRFTRYPSDPDEPLGMIDAGAASLHEDRAGRLWIGSTPGVSVLDPDRRTVSHYYHRYREYRYGWGTVRGILMDRSGRLWLATPSELMRLDPGTGTFTYHRQDPALPEGINSNLPTRIFQDRSGVVWVGTNGFGLNVHDPKASRFRTFRRPEDPDSRLARFSVYSVLEDSRGDVWIGAGVLYRWSRDTGELVSFETTSDRPYDFGNHDVWAMLEDPVGTLWVGSIGGLYRYDLATGDVRHYRAAPDAIDGLPEPQVRALRRARDGTLWLVTENYLVEVLDPERGRFRAHRYTDPPTSATWTFPVLHEDSAGDLWLGSHQGLSRFSPETGALRRIRPAPDGTGGLSHDVVRSVIPDPRQPDRYLWIGTAGGGLNRYDMQTEAFRYYTVHDGLPNNVVYGILPDDDGNLWLSTNQGLSRFDPSTGRFRNYDVSDGLQGNEFNSGAYFRSPRGELFFGGLHGISYFDPDRVRDNPHVPEVVLTAFRRANHRETVRDSGSALSEAISEARTIRVPYRDAVGFEFAALDYSAPEKNRYAYRMVGFGDDWVDAGTSRSATYTNLPPGQYTFQVRGSNNDGLWNSDGAAVELVVVPPWWRTEWAYASYVLLVLGLLYALRRYELGRARLKNRLELQRLESEKLRELDQARSRFFNDVSHEFRTPLTLTLGPLDDLLSGLHGPLPTDVGEQLSLARRNAARVLELINEIMELARAEAGRTTLRPRSLDLADWVPETTARFLPLAQRGAIRFDHDVPDEPVLVSADPELLAKALDNLLSNALKYTPAGGAVRVTVQRDDGVASIAVRDSGPGIPAEEQSRIFERFHRGEGAARVESGTGIGLALASELVQLHGGRLEVQSEEGFGSTFTLSLPVEAAPSTVAPDSVAQTATR